MMYLGRDAIGINAGTKFKKLTPDLSNVRDAYVTTTEGRTVEYKVSAATYCYTDAFPVRSNRCYFIIVQNGDNVASTNDRGCVVVDQQDIIMEKHMLHVEPGKKNWTFFMAENDGDFILCVDNVYKSIEIYEVVL